MKERIKKGDLVGYSGRAFALAFTQREQGDLVAVDQAIGIVIQVDFQHAWVYWIKNSAVPTNEGKCRNYGMLSLRKINQ